ncbi:MAG: hypothetical protein ACFE8L_09390 [Candidatus Hodarchaeota archaeon]
MLINYILKEIPAQKEKGVTKDLRGAFISAINTFAESAFNNTSLEYLESGSILFIFKISEIKSRDSGLMEPIIMYGLVDKKKKNPDKLVKKFFETAEPILELFNQRYNNADFTELNQFGSFLDEVKAFFK